jgi:hypothetical protein
MVAPVKRRLSIHQTRILRHIVLEGSIARSANTGAQSTRRLCRAGSRPHLADLPSPLPARSAARYTPATVTTRLNMLRTAYVRERIGGKDMANPVLVTGAAGRVGAVGRTVTELGTR